MDFKKEIYSVVEKCVAMGLKQAFSVSSFVLLIDWSSVLMVRCCLSLNLNQRSGLVKIYHLWYIALMGDQTPATVPPDQYLVHWPVEISES
jgi:hypothetical protein